MNGESSPGHIPVMLRESATYLNLQRGGAFLDCTFGVGGHSTYFLENFPNIQLFAIDRDPQSTFFANKLHQSFGTRFQFFNTVFSKIHDLSLPPLRGILFDFGISSAQLDDPTRGFSFRYHSPLDMRMDPSIGITAHEFLETADRRQLEEAVRDFGEERHWRRVVDLILKNRGQDVLRHGDSFAQLIADHLPTKFWEKIHPATRTFQGLRIAVNGELEEIKNALPSAFDLLTTEGRLVTLSFHSLEDRIVKQFFNEKAGKAINCHEKYHDRKPSARILTKKPATASAEEIEKNHRSRSVKLRALEKF